VHSHLARAKYFSVLFMLHAVVEHLYFYRTLTTCFHKHIFLAKQNCFRSSEFFVPEEIRGFRRRVPRCTAVTVPAVLVHIFAPDRPIASA
jgi:hypothetical protein